MLADAVGMEVARRDNDAAGPGDNGPYGHACRSYGPYVPAVPIDSTASPDARRVLAASLRVA